MVGLLIASLVFLAPAGAAAQEPAVAVTVDLGIDAALVGERASLSVVISKTSEAPAIGGLQFELAFPSKLVSFKEVTKARGATQAAAEVKSAVVKSPTAADEMILRVEVSASQPLPEGPLVALVFEVAKDTPGESQVKLRGLKAAAQAVGGATLTARALDGTLTVLNPNSAVFACFFYMH